MPPSRHSSKRKIDEDDNLPEDGSSQMTATQESQLQGSQSSKTKKARTDATKGTPENVNKVLPINISFPARIQGTLRIAAWNICGLAASQKKVDQMIYWTLW
jgi:AP endonuclease 1